MNIVRKILSALFLVLVFASFATAGQLTLKWNDNSTDETGFEVERCLGASCTSFGRITVVPAGATSQYTYIDTTALEGNTYCYRVRGVQGTAIFSAYSNTACGTVALPAPTNLVVTP